MRLSDGSKINNVARLEKQEEIEAESAEIDKEIENTPKPEIKDEVNEGIDEDYETVSEENEDTEAQDESDGE